MITVNSILSESRERERERERRKKEKKKKKKTLDSFTWIQRVYLKKRKGFARIALERGASLVPIYYFGNSQLLDFLGGSNASRLSRSLRTSLLLYYGRWYLPIPYQASTPPSNSIYCVIAR